MFSISRWSRRFAICGAITAAILIPRNLTQSQEPAAPATATQSLSPLPMLQFGPAQVEEQKAKDAPQPIEKLGTAPTPVAEKKAAEPKSAWFDNPPYRKTPRTGFFGMPPGGPGHYSLMDCVLGEVREAPPKFGYPPFALMATPLYDADFRYVDDPKSTPDFLERLHRIHVGDNWLVGTGGQAWWRHMHEVSSRLTGRTNDYDLLRVRVFGDVWYKDTFRIYAEFVGADSLNENLAPLRIDENHGDFQNLFIDLKIAELDCRPVYVRAGRQELLLGSQRLISPPDWANTRRTFQGVRGFWSNDKFDVDLFWVQPVLANRAGWSSIDNNQNFYGAWVTYRPEKKESMELYYLFLDNSNTVTAAGLGTAPTRVHTLGTRYSGDKNGFLWDFEGMLQLGDRGPQSICAGAATAGIGYNAKNLPMNPTVWGYYDWASGDSTPNAGNYNTFNQLFPFGHYYFGALDLVGRQNIRDWNAHLYLYPAKWVTLNAQYHIFTLDSARDALYNFAGAPTRVRLNGTAGRNVGQEIDLLANFHVSKHSDILVGYSRLNAGDFIRNTGNGRSAELFYAMYNFRW